MPTVNQLKKSIKRAGLRLPVSGSGSGKNGGILKMDLQGVLTTTNSRAIGSASTDQQTKRANSTRKAPSEHAIEHPVGHVQTSDNDGEEWTIIEVGGKDKQRVYHRWKRYTTADKNKHKSKETVAFRFADILFESLQTERVQTSAFVNFTTSVEKNGEGEITSMTPKLLYHDSPVDFQRDPSWRDILCEESRIHGFPNKLKSTCANPITGLPFSNGFAKSRQFKIFVQGFRDLKEYSEAILTGAITAGQNRRLFAFVFSQWESMRDLGFTGMNLINHNMDVATLHFKFK
jgi:hypothetical protein